MLSEISQKKKEQYCMIYGILNENPKTKKKIKMNSWTQRTDGWLPEAGAEEMGKIRKEGKKVHIFSYKISKTCGCNVKHGDCINNGHT